MRSRAYIFLFILTLFCGLSFLSVQSTIVRAQPIANRTKSIIVTLDSSIDINTITSKYNLNKAGYIKQSNSYLLSSSNGSDINNVATSISQQPGVLVVEPNSLLTTPLSSLRQPVNFPGGDPTLIGTEFFAYQSQPLVSFFELPKVQSISQGAGVKIAVIDTGIDSSHRALANNIADDGYDFVDNDNDPNDESGGPSYGHGTFISGLVVLVAPQAQILPLRALGPDGLGNAFDIATAIYYAVDHGAKVINLSMGTTDRPTVMSKAIVYAQSNGCIVTAAAGNSNIDSKDTFPANAGSVVGVGAVDFDGLKTGFSNYGAAVTLDAPGVELISTFPGGYYATWDGTSFATPLVSAESALLFANNAGNANKIVTTMSTTATKIDKLQPTYTGKLGKGLIAPLKALQN